MANVVYLLSSLPSLTFGQSPPVSLEHFLSEAREQLPAPVFEQLHELDLKDVSRTGAGKLKSFPAAMDLLQADVLEMRQAWQHERSATLSHIPRSVAEKNPLDREKSIMKWQWEQLSELDSGAQFTLTEVFVYKLKLQILHRLASFNAEKGLELLESLVNPPDIMEDL